MTRDSAAVVETQSGGRSGCTCGGVIFSMPYASANTEVTEDALERDIAFELLVDKGNALAERETGERVPLFGVQHVDDTARVITAESPTATPEHLDKLFKIRTRWFDNWRVTVIFRPSTTERMLHFRRQIRSERDGEPGLRSPISRARWRRPTGRLHRAAQLAADSDPKPTQTSHQSESEGSKRWRSGEEGVDLGWWWGTTPVCTEGGPTHRFWSQFPTPFTRRSGGGGLRGGERWTKGGTGNVCRISGLFIVISVTFGKKWSYFHLGVSALTS